MNRQHETKRRLGPTAPLPRGDTSRRQPVRSLPEPGTTSAAGLLNLQRAAGNAAALSYLAAVTPGVQRKTMTDAAEKAAYGKVLSACTSTSTTAGTQNVLAGVGSIPNPLQGKVRGVVTIMNRINLALNAPGAGTDIYLNGQASDNPYRMNHDNRGGWLPNPATFAAWPAATAAINAWAGYTGGRYMELTVDSDWRLVWDLNTNSVYLTLHYDDDGTHSPFFLITGLTF